MRNIILHIIGLRNGIKAVDLALHVMSLVNPQRFDTEIYHRAIDDLISCEEIKSFEYEDPEYPDKIMFMYFSKGTNFLNLRSFDAPIYPIPERVCDCSHIDMCPVTCSRRNLRDVSSRIHTKEIDMVRESVRNLQVSYITEEDNSGLEGG